MAFIREVWQVKGGKKYRWYALVENHREGKKVRQKFLYYLGMVGTVKNDAYIRRKAKDKSKGKAIAPFRTSKGTGKK